MDPELYQRKIPLFILSILGIWMIAEWFLTPLKPLVPITDTIRTFATIIAAASWGLGNAVLVIAHARRIYRRTKTPHWIYSVIFQVCFWTMLIAGIAQGSRGEAFQWLYNTIIAPAHRALYSTTAFYITTAGYRVFRFRNLDAAVLLISGMFVLWSVLPLFKGPFPILGTIGAWISDVIAVACYRAFVIGVALGIIGLALRIFLHKHPEVLT